jgi:hypothetical protein
MNTLKGPGAWPRIGQIHRTLWWPYRCHCSPGRHPSRDPASQHLLHRQRQGHASKLVWAVLAVHAHTLEASRNRGGAILVSSTLQKGLHPATPTVRRGPPLRATGMLNEVLRATKSDHPRVNIPNAAPELWPFSGRPP